MTGDHLSDHDWKTQMAAAGKALYLPGKTAEEIAEDAARKAEDRARLMSRNITLTNQQWSAVDTAIPDVIGAMYDVKNVFSLFAWADDLDTHSVNSVLRLCARAIESMADKELEALDSLDKELRVACKGGREQ